VSILVTRITAMTLPAGCSALATPVACFRAAAHQLHVADACCVAISIDGTDGQTDGRTDAVPLRSSGEEYNITTTNTLV